MKKMSFLPINGPLALIKEEKIKDLTPRTKKNSVKDPQKA